MLTCNILRKHSNLGRTSLPCVGKWPLCYTQQAAINTIIGKNLTMETLEIEGKQKLLTNLSNMGRLSLMSLIMTLRLQTSSN